MIFWRVNIFTPSYYFFSGWFFAVEHCWKIKILFSIGQNHWGAIALLVFEFPLALDFACLLTGKVCLHHLFCINFFSLRWRVLIKNNFGLWIIVNDILIWLVQSIEVLNLNILLSTAIKCLILFVWWLFVLLNHLCKFIVQLLKFVLLS